jgi:hypothetical protein
MILTGLTDFGWTSTLMVPTSPIRAAALLILLGALHKNRLQPFVSRSLVSPSRLDHLQFPAVGLSIALPA